MVTQPARVSVVKAVCMCCFACACAAAPGADGWPVHVPHCCCHVAQGAEHGVEGGGGWPYSSAARSTHTEAARRSTHSTQDNQFRHVSAIGAALATLLCMDRIPTTSTHRTCGKMKEQWSTQLAAQQHAPCMCCCTLPAAFVSHYCCCAAGSPGAHVLQQAQALLPRPHLRICMQQRVVGDEAGAQAAGQHLVKQHLHLQPQQHVQELSQTHHHPAQAHLQPHSTCHKHGTAVRSSWDEVHTKGSIYGVRQEKRSQMQVVASQPAQASVFAVNCPCPSACAKAAAVCTALPALTGAEHH